MSKRDWRVVPIDWNEKITKPGTKLKIAYYDEDGIFPPTPGVKRALKVHPFFIYLYSMVTLGGNRTLES